MARYDEQFMRHTDALAWNMEHDPGLRSTIVGVTWLDARPDFEVLTARLDRATRIAPRFRQRPVRPARPVRHAPLGRLRPRPVASTCGGSTPPIPHTPRTVVEFARSEAMTEFDPSRPLWAMTLVEGLEGDRAALVLKLHHSLTDGVGAVQLGLLLFETTPEPEPVVPVEEVAPEPVPSGPELDPRGAGPLGAQPGGPTARGGVGPDRAGRHHDGAPPGALDARRPWPRPARSAGS